MLKTAWSKAAATRALPTTGRLSARRARSLTSVPRANSRPARVGVWVSLNTSIPPQFSNTYFTWQKVFSSKKTFTKMKRIQNSNLKNEDRKSPTRQVSSDPAQRPASRGALVAGGHRSTTGPQGPACRQLPSSF